MATLTHRISNAGDILTNTYFDETIITSNTANFDNDVIKGKLDEVPDGSGSILLNGTNQYLTTTNYSFGSNDFTIEAWVYPISKIKLYPCVFCNWTGSVAYRNAGGLQLDIDHNNNPGKYLISVNGTAYNMTTPVVYGAWAHVAFTRNVNTFTFWYNGANTYSQSVSGMTFNGTGSLWYIGTAGDNVTSSYLNANITNFRIVNGTAVYTANFTPSINPLTAITNTELLLNVSTASTYLTDTSSINQTITATGSPTFSSSTIIFPSTFTRIANTATIYISGEFDEISGVI
jgi:hypothetical protein